MPDLQPTSKSKSGKDEKVTIYTELPETEVFVYFVLWIAAVCYALYNAYLASSESYDRPHVINGWSFTGLKRDYSDYYFEELVFTFKHLVFYGVLHYFGAEVVKRYSKEHLPYYYVIYPALLMVFYADPIYLALKILQTMINFLFSFYTDQFTIWCFYISEMMLLKLFITYAVGEYVEHYYQTAIFLDMCWMNALRGLAFGLCMKTKRNAETEAYESLVNFFGYCFYFPTTYHGLLLLYEDFEKVYTADVRNFQQRTLRFGGRVVKFVAYLYMTVLLLHFFHGGLLENGQMQGFNYSTIIGLFFWLAFFYMLKMQIIFGLCGSACKAEGIRSNDPPKCVATIVLYSKMWRTFDQSMYWFMKRYIFKEVLGCSNSNLRRMLAAFLCFAFIVVWHGSTLDISIWAGINFLQITLEHLGIAFGKTDSFLHFYRSHLDPRSLRRVGALCIIPLFVFSCVGQFVFMTTYEVAFSQVQALWQDSIVFHGLTLFFAYCACQVAIEVTLREDEKKKKKPSSILAEVVDM